MPALTEAIRLLLLVHTPPRVASCSTTVSDSHNILRPNIESGSGLMAIGEIVVQPKAEVYVIRVLPTVRPVSIPEMGFIIAIDVSKLDHVPPNVESLSVVVVPRQP